MTIPPKILNGPTAEQNNPDQTYGAFNEGRFHKAHY
jgi:hypothetical protein